MKAPSALLIVSCLWLGGCWEFIEPEFAEQDASTVLQVNATLNDQGSLNVNALLVPGLDEGGFIRDVVRDTLYVFGLAIASDSSTRTGTRAYRVTTQLPPAVVTQQPPRDVAPRATATLPVRPPPAEPDPTPAKPENPAAEIASVVGAYARAIESRDIGAVRRAYPGLTADQARGFEQFFESARSINVTFRVVGLETNGNSADARLVGTYEYVSGSRTERQPVSFAASLRNDGSSWRLVSVR